MLSLTRSTLQLKDRDINAAEVLIRAVYEKVLLRYGDSECERERLLTSLFSCGVMNDDGGDLERVVLFGRGEMTLDGRELVLSMLYHNGMFMWDNIVE